jgi:hypothetical protein
MGPGSGKNFSRIQIQGTKKHQILVRIRTTAFSCGRICFPDSVAGNVHIGLDLGQNPDPTV